MGVSLQARRAEPERDFIACLLMAERFLEESPYGRWLGRNAEQLETFVRWMLEHAIVFVVESPAGGTVGMVAAVATFVPMTGDPIVDEVAWWVEPEFRGSTAGPRLLNALEAEVRTNYKCVLKMIAPGASSVGRYLEHRGYTPLETAYVLRFHEGDHGPELPRRRRQRPRCGQQQSTTDGAGPDR